MRELDFIWMNDSFVSWQDARIHVLTHSLHYGAGVFEGIRFYQTDRGPALFRLDDHIDRFFYSASQIDLQINYPKADLIEVIRSLIKKNKLEQGYVRPLAYFGYGRMGMHPRDSVTDVSIAVWPWDAYLKKDLLSLGISKVKKINPDATNVRAKFTGVYVNSILSTQDAARRGYDEALLLDYRGNIAEGPVQNVFIVRENVLMTPKADNILAGITRDTVIKMLLDRDYNVIEKDISVEEFYQADEAFFVGTASEVAPIGSLDGNQIGEGKIGPLTAEMRDAYSDLVYGKLDKYLNWLTYV